MDVFVHITTPQSASIATGLCKAMTTQNVVWGCFLTGDGVKLLNDPGFASIQNGAARIAVCEHSWDLYMEGQDCPIERGSQTVNSLMMQEASRVVSL